MKNRNLKHSDNWKTPPDLYSKLNKEFCFDFDPCPYSENEPIFDGLKAKWGRRNFINPPYSRPLKDLFIKKAIHESVERGSICVMLLPVSTSTRVFHELIIPNASEIRFIKKRVKFIGKDKDGNESKGSGMHDSMIVVLNGNSNLSFSTYEF